MSAYAPRHKFVTGATLLQLGSIGFQVLCSYLIFHINLIYGYDNMCFIPCSTIFELYGGPKILLLRKSENPEFIPRHLQQVAATLRAWSRNCSPFRSTWSPSPTPPPRVLEGLCYSIFSFMCMICISCLFFCTFSSDHCVVNSGIISKLFLSLTCSSYGKCCYIFV
jgi:hypothetical protein